MEKKLPQKTINGLTFFPVPEFSDAEIAFGAKDSSFFSRYKLPEVPEEFEDIATNLFFKGGKPPKMSEKVDAAKAIRALKAWLGSFAPSHEAKIATVGYALWLWTNEDALK